MNLANKNNHDLLQDLQSLVEKEKRCTHQVLIYLREVESRRLYLERGFSSLFAFCTEFLGYSEPEAQIRIQAMRLTKALPAVEEKIKTGQISLSVAAHVQSTFRKEEKRRKSEGLTSLTIAERRTVVARVEKTSIRESQKILAQAFPETSVQVQDRVRPLSESQSKIEFVASNGLVAKLERLKNLTAHKNFDGSMEKLIEPLADMALKKLDPMIENAETGFHSVDARSRRENDPKFKKSGLGNGTAPHGAHKVNRPIPSRYIPANTKRDVYLRDHGRCQYQDPATQRRCHSRHGIQFGHQIPFSLGGETTDKNLQLLCSNHNRFKSDRLE